MGYIFFFFFSKEDMEYSDNGSYEKLYSGMALGVRMDSLTLLIYVWHWGRKWSALDARGTKTLIGIYLGERLVENSWVLTEP